MNRSGLLLALCALSTVACSSDEGANEGVSGDSAGTGNEASDNSDNSDSGTGPIGGNTAGTGVPDGPDSGPCSLKEAAFCDVFDKPSPGGRGGDLDEKLWSVARASAKVNVSQGELISWPATTLSACGQKTAGVYPNEDIISCKSPSTGRSLLTSTFDDVNGPAFHSLRVVQPFDFKDRIGHITVDIDAKTQTPEGHGWWWELVIADQPVPIPYQEFISHALMARKAVVLDFQGISSFDGTTNELSAVFVEDGYKYARVFNRDQANFSSFRTKEEVLNHVEILISQDFLEVWATDLDDMSTFRRVARVDGLGLTFSRGYVNLQHSQYNAAKGGLDGFTTYHVGSLGFDGPKLPVPRSYQVPDALTIGRSADVKNLGYYIDNSGLISSCCVEPKTTPAFTLEGVDLTDAVEARINLNAWYFSSERSIEFQLNGGEWRTFAHPFPDSLDQTRAVSMPVDLADLKDGQNTLALRTGGTTPESPLVVANVELEVVPE
jgi:hypothetical protein